MALPVSEAVDEADRQLRRGGKSWSINQYGIAHPAEMVTGDVLFYDSFDELLNWPLTSGTVGVSAVRDSTYSYHGSAALKITTPVRLEKILNQELGRGNNRFGMYFYFSSNAGISTAARLRITLYINEVSTRPSKFASIRFLLTGSASPNATMAQIRTTSVNDNSSEIGWNRIPNWQWDLNSLDAVWGGWIHVKVVADFTNPTSFYDTVYLDGQPFKFGPTTALAQDPSTVNMTDGMDIRIFGDFLAASDVFWVDEFMVTGNEPLIDDDGNPIV